MNHFPYNLLVVKIVARIVENRLDSNEEISLCRFFK